MSVLAGILSRRADRPIVESAADALRRVISRHPLEDITVFQDSRICLMKVDVGAYGEPAFHVAMSGTVSMLVGEPLLRSDPARPPEGRARDLQRLHESWDRGDWTLLQQAQGVFCAAHYEPDSGTLSLIADKLGVRLLYYWEGEAQVVFASALRILEAHPDVPKVLDLRAVTEIASFGFPLGRRSPYKGVYTLKPAEIVRFSGKATLRRQYWSWDAIAVSARPESELLSEVHRRFMAAVAHRQRGGRAAVAFLSGGLDSRCVVAALRALGAQVYTYNFSLPNSQDHVFAAEFARKSGTVHHEEEMLISHPGAYRRMSELWSASEIRRNSPADKALLIWSGNGGSVGLGHVYMTPEVVALLRKGDLDRAIHQFLREQKTQVLKRLLHPGIVGALSDVLQEGMRQEFSELHCSDPGRDLYLFLLLNEQRHVFSGLFEDIDIYRLDRQLPFFDSDFLASVVATPLDLCLRHGFYTKWLSLFPAAVTSVPWQTYPGHIPCPLPLPEGVGSQWDVKNSFLSSVHPKRELLQLSSEMLSRSGFPEPILNKLYLRFATSVYRMGLRDYAYVLETALRYDRYWKACAGNYELPVRPLMADF